MDNAWYVPMHPNRSRSWLGEYIRFQSRYGYEPFMLTLAGLAVVGTGLGMWWLLAPGSFPLSLNP